MKYKQLTLEKRYQISALIKAGLNQKSIALELGVDPSTISRELKRNKDSVRGYNAELAQVISSKRHKNKVKRFSLTKSIEKYIRTKLKEDWSPEQIAGRMKRDTGVYVVHETIYRYIYTNKKNGGKLYKYLRHKNKKYHCRTKDYMARGILIDRTMIDKRPKIVEKKSRIGAQNTAEIKFSELLSLNLCSLGSEDNRVVIIPTSIKRDITLYEISQE